MKRAGKVFLALALVLAMLWTSTGTSNVPGVLAENVASMQSAKDNKEAVKEGYHRRDNDGNKRKKYDSFESGAGDDC